MSDGQRDRELRERDREERERDVALGTNRQQKADRPAGLSEGETPLERYHRKKREYDAATGRTITPRNTVEPVSPVSVEGEDERLRQHDAVVAACEAYVLWMHKRGVSKPTALQQAVQAYDVSLASPSSPGGVMRGNAGLTDRAMADHKSGITSPPSSPTGEKP